MTDDRPTATTGDCDTDLLTRYVHILLAQMAKGNQQELVLAQSEPLPDPYTPAAKQLPEEVNYGSLVGQLQATTHGNSPNVKYRADSQCEIKINGCPFNLAVSLRGATCTVKLTERDR
jgi:hypothetical protein